MNIDNMEYNTTRNHLVMREYGRHIQKMIEYLLSLEDKEKRQRNAYAVIELMGFLNPHLKNVEDFRHKLWDHLFLISDFKLEVASPYPIPTRETLKARPKPLRYPKRYPKFSHMGKNLEIVINKALAEENPDKRNGFANAIAYYMKLAYNNWHKETVHDDAIQAELSQLTGGQLEFTNTPYVKSFRPRKTASAKEADMATIAINGTRNSSNGITTAIMTGTTTGAGAPINSKRNGSRRSPQKPGAACIHSKSSAEKSYREKLLRREPKTKPYRSSAPSC